MLNAAGRERRCTSIIAVPEAVQADGCRVAEAGLAMFCVAGKANSRGCAAIDLNVKFPFAPHVLKSLKASLLATTAICAVMVLPHPASAQSPTGGSVVAGTAGISQAGAVTNINQSSQKAIINWQGFSVGAQNTVNFNQPNSSAATLNRVIGNEQSIIDGAINANGQVFIVNSAGVLFGKGSQVNVGGIVASTLDISNNDFMAGNYKFTGTSNASVVNQGRIRARGGGEGGGYVALLGKTVSNEGMIAARLGTVAMAAGEKITLNFGGDSLVDVTIDKGTLNALVQNKRAIIANGGQVIMTARAADQVLSAQVNNSGLIQARTMAALKGGSNGGKVKLGKIILYAHGGTTNVSGKLDASAPKGGNGGFIETSGDHVRIADSAVITTSAASGTSGTWLVDPTDFNINVGGNLLTTSGIGVDALKTMLSLNNVIITTAAGGNENGDININTSLNWTGANPALANSLTLNAAGDINVNATVLWNQNTLTLNAGKNVNVNNVMTATGSANFAATYGNGTNADGTPNGLYTFYGTDGAAGGTFFGKINFSGTGTLTLNGQLHSIAAGTIINNVAALNAAKTNPAGSYVLGADFALNAAANWTTSLDNGAAFTGTFNGLGHRLSPFVTTATSLFGNIGSTATISNLGISGANVTASAGSTKTSEGILADINQGTIINSFTAGTLAVSAASVSAGHLVGTNSGLIAQSHSIPIINGVQVIGGGLVGTNTGSIIDSGAWAPAATQIMSGTASTITYTGGLVGVNDGSIARSYSKMQIRLSGAALGSNALTGGFVGLNTGTIDQSYADVAPATGSIYLAGRYVAGFVGSNTGIITNAYATSAVTGGALNTWDAGFAYKNSGTIANSYAVSQSPDNSKPRYGFVFDNTGGTITNSYWSSTAISGPGASDNSPAKQLSTTPIGSATNCRTDMCEASTFASYADFDPTIWGASVSGYPILRNMLVYIRTNNPTEYGFVGPNRGAGDLNLSALGLQGGGGIPLSNVTNNAVGSDVITAGPRNPFGVIRQNGYIDAGAQAAGKVLTGPYANFNGVVIVNPIPLTIYDVVSDKTYDGTTSATLVGSLPSNGGLYGMPEGQTLTINYTSATFADKNAGFDKTVNLTYTVSDGAGGGKLSNFILPTTTTATITPKSVIAAVAGQDKVYDGTSNATVTFQLPGTIAGDNLSLNYGATFADKNAGQNKTVIVSGLNLTGTDAANYTLLNAALQNTTIQTTASITPRPVNLLGNRAADGTASFFAPNLTVMNAVGGDQVQIGGTAQLGSAAAGTQSITNLSALTLNNPNYTLVGSVGSVVIGGNNLVLSGAAPGGTSIATVGSTTTITQTTDKAILDWQRFSVAAGETLTFVQPAATSVILNRVIGNEASVIAGALNANGRVFIVNSAGVLFQAGSQVNVGALVASTLNISNSNFNAGNYLFTATAAGAGSIVAKGDIVITEGGFLAFGAGSVANNSGSVTARSGKAVLAAADNLTLTLNSADRGLAGYGVASLSGSITAGGSINVSANGGSDGSLDTAGNGIMTPNLTLNTGAAGTWSLIQNSIVVGSDAMPSGTVLGNALATTNLSLRALTGEVIVNDAIQWAANTGLALNAATNININRAIMATGDRAKFAMTYGGDYNILTPASFSGAVLTLPELRQVIVTVVNPNGTKAGNSLEPVYDEDGNPVYEIVPGSGDPVAKLNTSGGFYGSITLSGDHGSNRDLTINNQGYRLIRDQTQLAAISGTTDRYALAQNLNLSGTTYTGPVVSTLANGSTFAGLGHVIDGLTINIAINNSSINKPNVGLFGSVVGSTIRDLGMTNANINVSNTSFNLLGVGALAGSLSFANVSTLRGVYSTGAVTATGNNSTGGLIGQIQDSGSTTAYHTLTDAFSSAVISSNSQVGGLVGSASGVSATRLHATGNVTGGSGGGLFGFFQTSSPLASLSYSYASGAVNRGSGLGGLIGSVYADYGTSAITANAVTNSFASGAVNGGASLGGLIGSMSMANGTAVLNNTYASGAVTANFPTVITTGDGTGGLVGYINIGTGSVAIKNSHATGAVTVAPGYGGTNFGTTGYSGGLVGNFNDADSGSLISNSYATGDVVSSKGYGGGLAGWLYGVSIAPVTYATGNVTCYNICGGLVGFISNGNPAAQAISIRGVYSTGTVTATSPPTGGGLGTVFVGALIGQVGSQRLTIADTVAYNAAGNPGMAGIGNAALAAQFNVGSNGARGLNAGQLADARFYANGTINQVLADRANAAQAAAVQQAAAQAAVAQQGVAAQGASIANSVSNNARTSSMTPPDLSASEAGTRAAKSEKSAAIEESVKSVDDAVKADDKRQEQERAREQARRRAAAQASHRGQAGGGGLGATIRSIDVNGQRFNLDGGGAPKPDAPAQPPQ